MAGDQPARSGRVLSCVFETTISGFTGKLRDEFLNGEIFYTLPEAVLPSTVENVFISEGHGGTLKLESRAEARGPASRSQWASRTRAHCSSVARTDIEVSISAHVPPARSIRTVKRQFPTSSNGQFGTWYLPAPIPVAAYSWLSRVSVGGVAITNTPAPLSGRHVRSVTATVNMTGPIVGGSGATVTRMSTSAFPRMPGPPHAENTRQAKVMTVARRLTIT